MTSPLTPNATLTFMIGTGVLAVDPLTGNPIPKGGLTAICQAYLKSAGQSRPGNRTGDLGSPGVDESTQYLTGYITDPLSLPQGVVNGSKAWAVFPDANGTTRKGYFTLNRTVRTAYEAIADGILGAKISGVFQLEDSGAGGAPPMT